MFDQIEQPQSMSIEEAAAQLTAQMQQDEQAADSATEQVAAEPAEESQDVSDDINADAEGDDTEQTPTEESPEEEGPSIESLSDLAEALQQPLEQLEDNLTATVTINGETKQVTLKELKAGFQLEQASRQNMQRAAEIKRQFEAEKQQHMADLEKQHQVIGNVLAQLQNVFVGQINPVELERLKAENPGEYARVRLEIEDRMRAFDQLRQQGAQAYAEMDQGRSQERQHQLVTYAQGEREKLLEVVPDWNDSERQKVFGYLQGLGFADAQLSNVFDHREIVIARKAMLYDQMQEKAKTATAKVKQLPKLAKPGPKQSGVKVESAAIEKARRRFAQTKSLEDAARLAALQMN